MAKYSEILTWTLKQEDPTLGTKIVNLMDGGGRTRLGIAEHDQVSLPEDFYTCDVNKALSYAYSIYREHYWNPIQGDNIFSDELAASLFSFCVNDGISRAVKLLQDCLGFADYHQDGQMGPITLQNTNAHDGKILAAALRTAQADFYRAIVAKQPSDARFLDGWLKRAKQVFPNLE